MEAQVEEIWDGEEEEQRMQRQCLGISTRSHRCISRQGWYGLVTCFGISIGNPSPLLTL